ncbi:MAG TPA: hypothetical protein VN922_05575, partial [Bacteroidia bacterium]|nr:hypothetical protein [Bacteroidia bacterium]
MEEIKDLELTATVPAEMVASQQQLIAWCEKKIVVCSEEVKELGEAAEHAKKNKWKSGPLQAQHNKAIRRVQFYEKIKGALEEGYYIVPNFPIEIFAIRKGANRKPTGKQRSGSRWGLGSHRQEFQELPSGEGVYRNPFPLVITQEKKKIDGSVFYESY